MASRTEVDSKIAAATLELLRTRGPRGVTVEAVTARSGVAKTTIYRRYSDRRDMLAAALSSITTTPALDAHADPQDRLRWVIDHAVDAVESGIGFGGFAALLTDEDAEFTDVFRRILAEQRATLESVVTQTWPAVDAVTLIDALVGAYTAERARTGAVADGWQERFFTVFWPALGSA
ncbi:TetR/AcrR family transcriptional regulator [Mycolicibacterium sp. 018/SC-01/001]|uniref:TetR/AcrR family transcriptional regulator n=1 Tax=Mycolicibacterium sp. 018/SC-01/001 TaxID=2592069 RepID=UPI00118134E0|nr:helix-turn-helix domain-containing protein [Mycolicibacterium sp. 018/SC-01/001]TRW86171.1 TetR/AcrR family transcriptional regulator [Mycolicibacterium sp. 018/SC-01/001]